MPQFFMNKRLIILLVSIIVLVALIGFSLRERSKLSWPEQFVKDTTGWVQSLVSKPTNYVAGFFENLQDLTNTYEENKELKSRVENLASLEAQVQELKNDNKELRDVLGEKKTLRDYEPLPATVIGRNPDRWHEMIIIDKGKLSGVKKNMAVVTANGLIGKVKSVTQFSSTVQLLSSMDPKNRISAIVQGKTNVYGLVEGYDSEKKLLQVKAIPSGADIQKGQTVITSGLGDVFPKGLMIGKVVEVKQDQYGLNLTALVKPGADFYDIKTVIVTKRVMAQAADTTTGTGE
ncbi:rod shape-determining protein MreC [Neobacillus bataviensis]|jgi:rod shape-determining protein MreC|uniref:Cell shape-determining protein MreC n=1 Tax=Neobacillus bataviensis TaxID=220685 RepID=A0A561DGT2_9BACI|nr:MULTISPECIES: rod shape-determining protein MreC [Bacillaceae]MCM3725287.1 rod shape-determining protein MreC [Neobacillus cucumis]PFO03562.1 rod shape-determining protein MreC [Bacillus sp. AFS076308]PGV54295.1 rod shape-determining protein MreC [Bacillus sp. AFS037270]TWE02548.1 rod shape-determining protein MreC [Neobacillus bataviensis]